MRRPLILLLLTALARAAVAQDAQTTRLRFSGYVWQVRPALDGGPGPNHWDPRNAWVDGRGRLHLRITHSGRDWRCAEVFTIQRLGFGTYQFKVRGPIDRLDPNVVLGLFNYPTPDVGPDKTNEIDIEFSHWGNPATKIGSYTVYPAQTGVPSSSETFGFTLRRPETRHRFDWRSGQIAFRSLSADGDEIGRWTFRPAAPLSRVPQRPLPVHLNLWLFGGKPPTDGKDVEIVISHFSYTPLGAGRRTRGNRHTP